MIGLKNGKQQIFINPLHSPVLASIDDDGYFSEDAVDFLIKNGIKFMAMDTPSPDNGSNINSIDDSPNHKNLLRNNVVIVEYLTNTDLIDCQKVYNIYALPLKVKNSDGSPCRVILVEK